MNDTKKAKIARFLDDKVMAEAVYSVLLDAFLNPRTSDTNYLAASMIAIGQLKDAWKELEKQRPKDTLDISRSNPGL